MISLDTNVVVRLLTGDDAAQTKRAARLVRESDVWISKTVLLETEWVLRRAYELEPGVIVTAFAALLGLPNLSVEEERTVTLALDAHRAGLDLADALHLASSKGAEAFATFDRRLARTARGVRGLPDVRPL